MSSPLVGIVILNWNGLDLIKKCFESVQGLEYPSFVVTIVDNGSVDGSVKWLKRLNGATHVLYNPKNLGFAPAINQGLSHSVERGCKYVVSLNNDVVVDPAWLTKLVHYMEVHDDCGFAQGSSMQQDNKKVFDSTGMYLERGFIPRQRASGSEKAMLDIPAIGPNAAGSIYRSEMLQAVSYAPGKYFDDHFFAYVEDVDFNLRCTLRGYEFGFVPKAILYHVGSATGNRIASKKMFWGARNLVWFMYKNIPFTIFRKTFRIIVISHLANIQYLRREQKEYAWPYIWGLLVGLLGVWMFFGKRRRNLKLMKLSNKAFYDLLVPSSPPVSNPFRKLKSLIK
jgi:GT2 family glycosyltransferase